MSTEQHELTERDKLYWATNLRLIITCICIWALVAYGGALIFRPMLMSLPFGFGGVDLGFWFAQQGSVLTFLALVTFYSWRMNKLDKEFGLED